MTDGIEIENGIYGPRAILKGRWSPGMLDVLLDAKVAELELNDGKGWRGGGLDIFARLPELKALSIIALNLKSVEPVHCLHELRALTIITYCQTELRFAEFPFLEQCTLEWRPKATSVFACTTLRDLSVSSYDGLTSEPFGCLSRLQSLSILKAPIVEIRNFAKLSDLRSLRLGLLKNVKSLSGVEHLVLLEDLNIERCKGIQYINELSSLLRLKRLHLGDCGEIESLKPLSKLVGLEAVTFDESTNILDGDLSPLAHQHNLSRVGFMNRKHYSHRCEDFRKAPSG